jgi:hypothetical protein
MHDLRTRLGIDPDRIHRTRSHAPRFRTLRAGVRHLPPRVLKVEDLDPRFRYVEYPMVLVRTRHLALQTARAFVGINVQRFLHDASGNWLRRKRFSARIGLVQ